MAKQGVDTDIVGAAVNVERLLGKQLRVMGKAFARYPFGMPREEQKPEFIEAYTLELGSMSLYGSVQAVLPVTFDPNSVKKGDAVEVIDPHVVLVPKATLGKDQNGQPKAFAHLELTVEAAGLRPVQKTAQATA